VLPDLRIDPPQLEPDDVLLQQLSQLSRASVAQRGQGQARSFVAGVTVVVVAGFSWLTGTLPGVASPFDRPPAHHRPAPAQDPTPTLTPDGATAPSATAVLPGAGLGATGRGHHSGQAKPHQDNGNHTGQTEPHQDNGNHTGQTKPHQDNGNHTGQTKPHQNNGNHTGQTKPHQNNGNHTGHTKPHHGGHGPGQGNGHVK
jgi:hypothetical protein